MPSKKAQRKAAARGTTVEEHRATATERADARRVVNETINETRAREILTDPESTARLRGALEESKNFADLWDNPMVRAARDQMTPEQVAQYERLGREMYGTLDFENINESKAEDDLDAEQYIEQALRSGLRPCDLEDDEKAFMSNLHGARWYEEYGGYGCPLPGATANEVVNARNKRVDTFMDHFGGKRLDLVKVLGGKK